MNKSTNFNQSDEEATERRGLPIYKPLSPSQPALTFPLRTVDDAVLALVFEGGVFSACAVEDLFPRPDLRLPPLDEDDAEARLPPRERLRPAARAARSAASSSSAPPSWNCGGGDTKTSSEQRQNFQAARR